ncbi:MAG: hypothetical protein QXH91_04790 [Candidatus Bathyarchaeia archaeon]
MHYVLARSIAWDMTFEVSRNFYDAAPYSGKYYSQLAPGLGFLATPLVWLGERIQNTVLKLHWISERSIHVMLGQGGVGNVLGIITVTLLSALAAVTFYDFLSLLKVNSKKRLSLTFLLMFGTFIWSNSVRMSHHVPAMFLSLTAVVFAIKYNISKNPRFIMMTGLAIGASSVIEWMTGIFLFPLAWYIWKKQGNPFLLFPALIGPIIIGCYNYLCFGNPLIFGEQLKSFGVPSQSSLLEQFNTPIYLGLFGLLFSPYRGLFLFAPITLMSFLGVKPLYQKWRDESILFALMITLILLPYSAWSDWAGGFAFGPRFLTSIVPYTITPLAFCNLTNKKLLTIYRFLFVVSCFINLVSVTATDYRTRLSEDGLFVPVFILALQNLMAGDMNFLLYKILWYFLP